MKPLSIGIVCFPSIGGSGVVAAESGIELARRGHTVHFFCHGLPQRISGAEENIFVHEVRTLEYAVFPDSQYDIALASKIISVCQKRCLDVLHVHYAIPHAVSAYLAKQALDIRRPWVITTLHGTDITLVGRDPSFLPIARFSILQSDAVITPSQYLKDSTYEMLSIPESTEINVIPNFINETLYAPSNVERCSEAKILTHVSNFRPVKRVADCIHVLAEVQKSMPARLVLVGDGPERSKVERLVAELGMQDSVCFLGARADFVEIIQRSDLFLLPSEEESFGLAALEALACAVPVVASNAGGISEVVTDGLNGILCDIADVKAMGEAAIRILSNSKLHQQMKQAARQAAVLSFKTSNVITEYENLYSKLLEKSDCGS